MGIRDAAQSKLAEALGEEAAAGTDDLAVTEIVEEPEPVAPEPRVDPVVPVEEAPTEEEAAAAAAAGEEAAAALGEEATDEEREEARVAAEEEFYAATYRTREEAERGIAEKDETIQRLYRERDQALRQAEEAQQETEPDEEKSLDLPAWDHWARESVAAGLGSQGAIAALEEGGYEGYQIYMRHWMLASDPETGEPDFDARAQASLFKDDMILQIAEVRAAAAARAERERPTSDQVLSEAQAIVKARRPDYDQYADAMNEVIAEMDPADAQFLKELAESGVKGRAKAIEMVYLEAKSRGPAATNSERAKDVERRRRASSADAATLAATTSSSEAAPARTTPPETEQIAQDRKAGIRERQKLQIPE